jgi:hypothetical protein
MPESPMLDEFASEHFTYRDLCHCGETWRRTGIENSPLQAETYKAIARLCKDILEPVLRNFGRPELTYGFAGPALARHISGRISPRLDQHAGHERARSGALICPRLGQAADLKLPAAGASTLAAFIAEVTPFDRLYVYGEDRSVHVSCGPSNTRAIVSLQNVGGRLLPRRIDLETLKRAKAS